MTACPGCAAHQHCAGEADGCGCPCGWPTGGPARPLLGAYLVEVPDPLQEPAP